MRTIGRRALHRRASGPSPARGFSLLEVMMVLLLIAAASALAAVAVTGGFTGMRLRAEAKEIAAQLRFTRAQAISTGRAQRFLIDPAARTWLAPDDRKGEVGEKFGVAFFGAREVQPMRGVGAIMFFPDGASTGGRVQLTANNAAWNIDVQWLTGEVKVARAASNEHEVAR
jgi:general secretion pathway protein H